MTIRTLKDALEFQAFLHKACQVCPHFKDVDTPCGAPGNELLQQCYKAQNYLKGKENTTT